MTLAASDTSAFHYSRKYFVMMSRTTTDSGKSKVKDVDYHYIQWPDSTIVFRPKGCEKTLVEKRSKRKKDCQPGRN